MPRDLPWSSTERAIFADALADGDSITKAARRAGRTPSEGERQFRRMEAELGEAVSPLRKFGNTNAAGPRGFQLRPRRYEPKPRWSPERTAALQRLLNDGLTFAEAGRRLGVTRDQVAGKAARLARTVARA